MLKTLAPKITVMSGDTSVSIWLCGNPNHKPPHVEVIERKTEMGLVQVSAEMQKALYDALSGKKTGDKFLLSESFREEVMGLLPKQKLFAEAN